MTTSEFKARQKKLRNELLADIQDLLEKIDEVYEGVIYVRHYPDGWGYLFDEDNSGPEYLVFWDDLVEGPKKLKEFYWGVMGVTQLDAIAQKLSPIQKEALMHGYTGCIGERCRYNTWTALSRHELIAPLNEVSWKRDNIQLTTLGRRVAERVKCEAVQ